MHKIIVPYVDLKDRPCADSGTDTQILQGEGVKMLLSNQADYHHVEVIQENDHYQGYVHKNAVLECDQPVTHRVVTRSTLLFSKPHIKIAAPITLSLGACLVVTQDVDDVFYKTLCGHYVIKKHLIAFTEYLPFSIDRWIVFLKENFYHAPYLWGGRSSAGIDCSGLVQLSLQAFGIFLPRDTGPQERFLQNNILQENIQAGDIVFWKGHVGIMVNDREFIHANAHHMQTVIEPFKDVVARSNVPVSSIKRISVADVIKKS